MPPAGLELTIPASETHALNRAATGICTFTRICNKIASWDNSSVHIFTLSRTVTREGPGRLTKLMTIPGRSSIQLNSVYFCSSDPEGCCNPQDIEHVNSV